MLETELRRRYLAACARAFPDLRLFNRNVGFFKTPGGGGFRAGIKGQADVYGDFKWKCAACKHVTFGEHSTPCSSCRGRGFITRPVEVELKRFGQSLKPEQEQWRKWCEEWGVPYLLLVEKSKNAPPSDIIGGWVTETRVFLASL